MFGSALNPNSLHTGKAKKEIAKPNTKVEVKTFNRDARGGATEDSLKASQEQKKKQIDDKHGIWTEEEVNILAEEVPDDSPQP